MLSGTADALLAGTVPSHWARAADTLRPPPLRGWVLLVRQRLRFFQGWHTRTAPSRWPLGLFARPNSFLISVLKDWAGGANHEPSQCTFGFGTVVDEDESDRGDDDEGLTYARRRLGSPRSKRAGGYDETLLGDGVDAPWLVG